MIGLWRDNDFLMSSHSLLPAFGLSGVGKTRLLTQLEANIPNCIRLSVSELMTTTQKMTAVGPNYLRMLPKEKILENQNHIVAEIRKASISVENQLILLDAHSVIDNFLELIKVPVEIIRSLRPISIVFIYDEPENIAQRRKDDSSRQRPSRTISELTEQQDIAREICSQYATILSLTYHEVASHDYNALKSIILSHMTEIQIDQRFS